MTEMKEFKEKDLDKIMEKLEEAAQKVSDLKNREDIQNLVDSDDYIRYFVLPFMLIDSFSLHRWPEEFIESTRKRLGIVIDKYFSPYLSAFRFSYLVTNGFSEDLIDRVIYNVLISFYKGEKAYLDLKDFNHRVGGELMIQGFDLLFFNSLQYLGDTKNPYIVESALVSVGLSSSYASDLVKKFEQVLLRVLAFDKLGASVKEFRDQNNGGKPGP
jgi:hypothetical protein